VWLRDERGVRTPLVGGTLLLGRSSACHVVLSDPSLSRQHALVIEIEGGARVVPLGRAGVSLSGARLDEPAIARDGDVLALGAARFTLEVSTPSDSAAWHLEVGTSRYPVRGAGFRLGGGPACELVLPGWPERAATLYPTTSRLLADVHAGLEVTGSEDAEGMLRLGANATLGYAGISVRVVLAGAVPATLDLTAAPSSASIELMPNGALLRLMLDRGHAVWLPLKRGDLVAALLSPPAGQAPGSWVADDLLIPRIWGGASATRTQLNTLIHRTRVSLGEAGLNGPGILERQRGGGATRFRLAVHATTSVT